MSKEKIKRETSEVVSSNQYAEDLAQTDCDAGCACDAVKDDADMPEPATRKIETFLRLTPRFFELLNQSVGALPYNTVLESREQGKIKLNDLVKFLETHQNKLTINEVNTAIGFVACGPYIIVRPLMEVVESREKQSELWQAFEE